MGELFRFITAQDAVYSRVLQELKSGRKRSHWMWFIFPQLRGLGRSERSVYYGISDLREAVDYLENPVLGGRLRECAELLLRHTDKTAEEIMGVIDNEKLWSSMTLFALIDRDDSVFRRVIDAFYEGKFDRNTEMLLGII